MVNEYSNYGNRKAQERRRRIILDMMQFPSKPLDSVMHATGAESMPCHLLVELQAAITLANLKERAVTDEILLGIDKLRLIPGGFGIAPVWRCDSFHQWDISEEAYEGRLPDFIPEKHLSPLQGLARLTLIRRSQDLSWLVLSWKHTLCDARGGEELLRIAAGQKTTATLGSKHKIRLPENPGKSLRQYFSPRRKLAKGITLGSLSRHYLSMPSKDLWGDDTAHFFRSAVIAAAAVKVLSAHIPQLIALPVAEGRGRQFPGNQLGILHLMIPGDMPVHDVYRHIVQEMEQIVRDGLPQQTMQFLRTASRFGPTALRSVLRYPARTRFADLCISSLGISSIGNSITGHPVQTMRHYPPLFEWGGETVVYYEHGDTCTLVYLGEKKEKVREIARLIQEQVS